MVSIPSFQTAASNYASSFTPILRPVADFSDVEETRLTEALTNIPALRYKMEMEMAQQALIEGSNLEQQRLANQAAASANKLTVETERRRSLLNLAAAADLLGGTGGKGMQWLSPKKESPLQSLYAYEGVENNLAALRDTRMAGTNEAVNAALVGLGKAPGMTGGAQFSPNTPPLEMIPAYAPPPPASLPSVLDSMVKFHQATGQNNGGGR